MKEKEQNIDSNVKDLYKELPDSGLRYRNGNPNTGHQPNYAEMIANIVYNIIETLQKEGYLPMAPNYAMATPTAPIGKYMQGAEGGKSGNYKGKGK
jgi:hypothetical protein